MAFTTLRTTITGGTLLGIWCLTIGCCVAGAAAAASRNGRDGDFRPNIVLVMADDVGSEVLGCYGGTSYQTHQIDTLAVTGTRFTNCFSMPVCHPSRQTIMTGQYPFRHPTAWGSWPEGVTTFAQVLQQAGYATAVAGKWQLTLQKNNPTHPAQLGFDESAVFGWHEGPRYHQPMIYRKGDVWEEKRQSDIYGPEVYTEFLIDFMRRNKDRPFFAYYPMTLCHEISNDFQPVPPPGPDGRYRSFAEMVDDMDAAVGRVVTAIDRLGLRRKTVILFTTDDGCLIDVQNDPLEKNPIAAKGEPPQAAVAREVLEDAFESLDPAPAVDFFIKPGEVVLTVSGKPVATYIHADERIRRPYFAHVKSPGGIQLTRNHPPIAGKDREDHDTMHPGIWMAFGDLDGEDFWRNKGQVVHDAFIEKPTGGPGKGSFAVRNRYERKGGELVCREECRVTFLVRPEGYLLLWDSTFFADREFTFGDQEEMGLAFRVTTPITVDNGGTMIDSQGRKNGDGIWGKTADWCDYSGAVDGRRIGMTLMCHPDNFRPSWMHARDYGFIAANPFGRNAFTKGEPSKVVVTPGEKLRLRYGVLIHDGPRHASLDLKTAYEDYLTLSRAD